MLVNVSDYIEDSMEEAMQSYAQTEEYKEQAHEIAESISAFHASLPKQLQPDFLLLIDRINTAEADMVVKAYHTAFARGMCFRAEILEK